MDRHPILTIDDMAGEPPPPNALIHGNLLEFLERTPDGWADLVVTSPPYWKKVDYDGEGAKQADIDGGQIGMESSPDEYEDRLVDILLKVALKVKPTGCMVVNIGDTYMYKRKQQVVQTRHKGKFIGRAGAMDGHPIIPKGSLCNIPARVADRIMREGGYPVRSLDIWNDYARLPEPSARNRHWQKMEQVYHFSMGSPYYSKFSEKGAGSPGGNVLSILHSIGKGKHHATMPLALAAEYIDFLCPPNGVVFDPFGGEGTTAVAANQLGKSFVTIDVVREFCESSANRIANEKYEHNARPASVLEAVVEKIADGKAVVTPTNGRRSIVPLDDLKYTGATKVGDRLLVMIEMKKTHMGGSANAISQVFHYMPFNSMPSE